MRWTILLCGLVAAPAVVATEDVATWRVGEVTYRYTPSTRELTAACAGTTFQPLAGFGPVFLFDGAERALAETAVTLRWATRKGARLTCRYRAAHGAAAAEYSLEIVPAAWGLRLRLFDATAPCARVCGGQTTGLRQWVRVSYTRNAEPYGQPFWPRVAWDREQGVCVAARWNMAASNGATWAAPDQRFRGEGNFAAALDVVYTPRTDGSRLPLDETLELRVGRDFWQTVPLPEQQPSEYRAELARSVFVDVWGGTSARETEYFLRHLAALTQGRVRFYTVIQNWQAGGFDALLPDSLLMPDYPPNPGFGSVAEIQALARTARGLGRFALRTNYVFLREGSPSARAGRAAPALEPDGKKKWHTRPSDWLQLARRQETEIQGLFATNASFTDQITSGGGPWSYLDFDASQPGAGAMRAVLSRQRELCRLIKETCRGPLGSETNMDEQLLGEFVDTGDFGIFDGYHRAFTPEFKLRRIHHLSTFHGMGLMYRYFELPPFHAFHSGKTTYFTDPNLYDDYRAAEVLYGNGGYLFFTPDMPWDYLLTECLLVGTLQRHYALQPVRAVLYWLDGRWQPLETLLAAGVDPLPVYWAPQPDCLKRIRVRYANGLEVVVNRLDTECVLDAGGETLTLPRSGWAAWLPAGRLLAYSAYAPGTRHRIDFLRDASARVQYLNPRGREVLGQKQPTLWLDGKVVVRLDPATGDAWVRGEERPYRPPRPQPVTRLDFRFDRDLQGWAGQHDLGPLRVRDGALVAEITGPDPYLAAPPVDLAPDSVKEIVVRMRVSGGEMGQLYFRAEGADATAEQMCVRFPVVPGAEFRDIRIPVGQHPLWRGRRITWIRLDPVHGVAPGTVEIQWIRGE